MKTKTTLTVVLLLGLATAVPLPPAVANNQPCDETAHGFGETTATCRFSCGDNRYITVMASVDDLGAIEASAACGGAGAECADTGSCDGSSYPVATSVDGNDLGLCSATGNGGWWSRVNVYCSSQTAGGGGTGDLTRQVLDIADRGLQIQQSQGTPTLLSWLHVLQGADHSALISLDGGIASGATCDASGCYAVTPTCSRDGDLWQCTI